MREWKGDQVYRVDKARSMHFRYTETAVAFEDARGPVPKYRCWSSLVPVAFSQGRVPLGVSVPRGPKARHRSSLHFVSNIFRIELENSIDSFFFRAFTLSHYLATRTTLIERTGCSMSLSSSARVQQSSIDRGSRLISPISQENSGVSKRKKKERKKKREREEKFFSVSQFYRNSNTDRVKWV